jgi:uncharacterized membrane protein
MQTPTYRNVMEIAKIEQAALDRRSRAERLGDLIATGAGRMWFIVLHLVWFVLWIGLNATTDGFDPFPFSFLTVLVSLESIFLSLFILMSQNRSARQADQRSHLDLQINLLSEHENTKMLQMLQALCAHHRLTIGSDSEISDLAARTDPQQVIEELRKAVPGVENAELDIRKRSLKRLPEEARNSKLVRTRTRSSPRLKHRGEFCCCYTFGINPKFQRHHAGGRKANLF